MKRVIIVIVVAIIAMQFFRIDKTNPTIVPAEQMTTLLQPPVEVEKILKNACYDCHSYETEYPWYTDIAPISWWIKNHIIKGRENLNFSTWGQYDKEGQNEALRRSKRMVVKGFMPPQQYMAGHPEANLTLGKREIIAKWLESQISEE